MVSWFKEANVNKRPQKVITCNVQSPPPSLLFMFLLMFDYKRCLLRGPPCQDSQRHARHLLHLLALPFRILCTTIGTCQLEAPMLCTSAHVFPYSVPYSVKIILSQGAIGMCDARALMALPYGLGPRPPKTVLQQ